MCGCVGGAAGGGGGGGGGVEATNPLPNDQYSCTISTHNGL